ncbi:MAG: four helix bundle protein [Pirellula sp.]
MKRFALRAIRLASSLPSHPAGQVLGKQLLRSATSVDANYRAACRGRSRAEFAAKLGIVIEEADESCYWPELIMESDLLKPDLVKPLWDEANEIVAIMVSSRKTAMS